VIPAAGIVAEAERRSFTQPQTLAVLTLALDENWSTIPIGFFDQLANLPHPTVDPWYNLAQLRRVGSTDWQAFKMRLYRQLPAALPFILGSEGEDALPLTEAQAQQLLTDVAQLRKDVANIAAQLGPTLPGWPSLGLNAKGQELTWRDAFGVVKADVAAIKNKLLG
jgi:hypothetical protein